MEAVKYILVEADQDYNNEVELSGGIKIIVNTTVESVSNINREVTVVSAPKGTVLKKGDKLIIHHNILRRKNNMKGEEVKSDYFIQDNIYFVPPTEVFAYKRGEEDWIALDPFVFIEPIKETPKKTNSGIYLESGALGRYDSNVGRMQYLNDEVGQWGLGKGDKVFFKDDSEYEFEIEGKKLYRMKTSDILGRF